MVTICFSLMANDVEHLFAPIFYPYILFDEVSVQISCPSYNQVGCFLTVEF